MTTQDNDTARRLAILAELDQAAKEAQLAQDLADATAWYALSFEDRRAALMAPDWRPARGDAESAASLCCPVAEQTQPREALTEPVPGIDRKL